MSQSINLSINLYFWASADCAVQDNNIKQ